MLSDFHDALISYLVSFKTAENVFTRVCVCVCVCPCGLSTRLRDVITHNLHEGISGPRPPFNVNSFKFVV